MLRPSGVALCAAAVSFCLSIPAQAHERPVTALRAGAEAFATLADAARAALAEALPLSDRFEHGGALVNCAGTYRYTAPVTTRDPEHVEYEARVPRGCTLAGLYHTHPSSADSAGMFSPDDVRTSRALRVPSFIGIRRDGSIRVFDPASMSAARERGRLSYGASARGALLTKE